MSEDTHNSNNNNNNNNQYSHPSSHKTPSPVRNPSSQQSQPTPQQGLTHHQSLLGEWDHGQHAQNLVREIHELEAQSQSPQLVQMIETSGI